MKDNFSIHTGSSLVTVKGLDFLGLTEAKNLRLKSDGLLGLGPSKYLGSQNQHDRVFVDMMKKSGAIERSIFSVSYGKIDTMNKGQLMVTPSYIKFGGWDNSVVDDSMKNPDENDRGIKWLDPSSE